MLTLVNDDVLVVKDRVAYFDSWIEGLDIESEVGWAENHKLVLAVRLDSVTSFVWLLLQAVK